MSYIFSLLLGFTVLSADSKLDKAWPDMSIYHLTGKWNTHAGNEIELKNLAGKPVVLAMVYTSCQHTCPLITNQVMRVRKGLPKKMQSKVKYVLVSFDPDRDKPSVLAAYKKKRKLDDNWLLLTGGESLVRQLAGVLGVNYKKTADGEFSHSNFVSLLDKNGVVVQQTTGLNQATKDMSEKAKRLLN